MAFCCRYKIMVSQYPSKMASHQSHCECWTLMVVCLTCPSLIWLGCLCMSEGEWVKVIESGLDTQSIAASISLQKVCVQSTRAVAH